MGIGMEANLYFGGDGDWVGMFFKITILGVEGRLASIWGEDVG
jgi:hypothetical protein